MPYLDYFAVLMLVYIFVTPFVIICIFILNAQQLCILKGNHQMRVFHRIDELSNALLHIINIDQKCLFMCLPSRFILRIVKVQSLSRINVEPLAATRYL